MYMYTYVLWYMVTQHYYTCTCACTCVYVYTYMCAYNNEVRTLWTYEIGWQHKKGSSFWYPQWTWEHTYIACTCMGIEMTVMKLATQTPGQKAQHCTDWKCHGSMIIRWLNGPRYLATKGPLMWGGKQKHGGHSEWQGEMMVMWLSVHAWSNNIG